MSNNINKNGSLYIKQGGFYYNVSGNDALILNKYLGYKLYGVNQYRTGFPVKALDTVLKKIDKLNMNYEIYNQNGYCITSKEFNDNCYEILDESKFLHITGQSTKNEGNEFKKLSQKDKYKTYISILENISEGINCLTGEVVQGLDDEIKDYFLEIAMYFDKKIKLDEKEKLKNPSRGKKWSAEEDTQLVEEFKSGLKLNEIAQIHQRSRGAIFSRLSKHFNLTEFYGK